MARIRYLKPDFFRHERLQELERQNPGAHVMLIFAGLWTQSDKLGHFQWKPRQLKLDILPFLDFDMTATLEILLRDGFVTRYEVAGEQYGEVATFKKHQRISGKEAGAPPRYPEPTRERPRKRKGSSGEAPGVFPGALEYGVMGNGVWRDGDPARAHVDGKNGNPEAEASAYQRAAQVLSLYPAAAADGRAVKGHLQAQNLLAALIAKHPDYPFEEHAAYEASPVLNPKPKDAHNWVAELPCPRLIALEPLRKAAKARGIRPWESPEAKAKREAKAAEARWEAPEEDLQAKWQAMPESERAACLRLHKGPKPDWMVMA